MTQLEVFSLNGIFSATETQKIGYRPAKNRYREVNLQNFGSRLFLP
ncbi:MAG: hypothetical protein H6Q17_372 [Bacteroidetes bacterium]|nr:hypothetical protein [Bacteroidota bacterium]